MIDAETGIVMWMNLHVELSFVLMMMVAVMMLTLLCVVNMTVTMIVMVMVLMALAYIPHHTMTMHGLLHVVVVVEEYDDVNHCISLLRPSATICTPCDAVTFNVSTTDQHDTDKITISMFATSQKTKQKTHDIYLSCSSHLAHQRTQPITLTITHINELMVLFRLHCAIQMSVISNG
jgi:hypothetical protein